VLAEIHFNIYLDNAESNVSQHYLLNICMALGLWWLCHRVEYYSTWIPFSLLFTKNTTQKGQI